MPRKSRPRPTDDAPGSLVVVQRFVNSYDLFENADEIGDAEALGEWLGRHELLVGTATVNDKAWQAAVALRQTLRRVIATPLDGKVPAATLRQVNAILGERSYVLRFATDRSLSRQATEIGWHGAVARMAEAVAQAIGDGTWDRLKTCASEDCQWVFYDASSNLSSRWCRKRKCGNRIAAQVYRQRHPKRHSRRPWR